MRSLFAVVCVAVVGCDGQIGRGAGGGGGGGGAGVGGAGVGGAGGAEGDGSACFSPAQRQEAARIFAGLVPTCAGCHGANANTPIFANEGVFLQNLLGSPHWVAPGDPAQSELVRLLKGTGTRYPRMPLGALTYPQLVASGAATILIADVEALISGMKPCSSPPDAGVSPTTARLRRLSLPQLLASLERQLGLEASDFVDPVSGSKVDGEALVVYEPDGTSPLLDKYPYNFAVERSMALGARDALNGVQAKFAVSPSYLQHLTQVAPNWCRKAMLKPGCPLFRFASRTDGPDQLQNVKQNLRFMYLAMLSLDASNAQVDRLYNQVFVPLASPDGGTASPAQIEAAWVGACAALIRHPLWISY